MLTLRKTSLIALAAASLSFAAAAGADEVEVPPWSPEPPPVSSGPSLPPVAERFTPTDVAAAPAPPGGLFSPAPPAFDRFSCDTFSCGGGRDLGVIESPAGPGELPGDGAD